VAVRSLARGRSGFRGGEDGDRDLPKRRVLAEAWHDAPLGVEQDQGRRMRNSVHSFLAAGVCKNGATLILQDLPEGCEQIRMAFQDHHRWASSPAVIELELVRVLERVGTNLGNRRSAGAGVGEHGEEMLNDRLLDRVTSS
jgi:hypothetical protein